MSIKLLFQVLLFSVIKFIIVFIMSIILLFCYETVTKGKVDLFPTDIFVCLIISLVFTICALSWPTLEEYPIKDSD